MKAFFGRSYYCDECNVGYNNIGEHRCTATCPCCYATPPCKVDESKLCKDCCRYFRNGTCFENHKLIKKQTIHIETEEKSNAVSICDRIRRCKKCNKHLFRAHKKKHQCGYFDCRTCKKYVKQKGNIYSFNFPVSNFNFSRTQMLYATSRQC